MKKIASLIHGFFEPGMIFGGALHHRSDLHLIRKLWHMSMGLVIVTLYSSGVSQSSGVFILGSVFLVFYFFENLRLRVPALNSLAIKLFKPLMRENEVHQVSGLPLYALGSMVAILIFPKPVAILSILYLALGDPMASLFGILYGNKSIRFANGKTLVGTMAGVVVCTLVSFVFLSSLIENPLHLGLVSLVGGLMGGTAEMLPLDVDDNFSIPVVSGFAMWLIFILTGI